MEFKEIQKFTQWWIWLLIIGTIAYMAIGDYKQIILGNSFNSFLVSNSNLLINYAISIIVVLLFLIIHLKTEINVKEIRIRFFPLTHKHILWDDVKKAEIINYGFIGGWGIRPWTQYGTVYNIKGNKGLYIELKNGKKLVIGTQKEEEIREIVNYACKMYNIE